ncbi:glycoside hydrolase family 13 protein [Polymorphospora rubra]|uniref:Alpha-glycosidase n=1 Tax=Polymorphospora rubra TaxID=338584 RepID=A0A810N2A4_9ACTN|nr:glycoside hydrolase family 13 protein [Polymorphospora rubra]BCJ66329.1 alpha-glycosidase [Polymorphospora rubra]
MQLLHLPHHDGSPLYVSESAPALGQTVTVRVRVPVAADVTAVHVRVVANGEPVFHPAAVDPERTGSTVSGYGAGDTWWQVEVTAENPVTSYRFYLERATGAPLWLTAAGVVDHDVPDRTDFRLVSYAPPPDWMADAVVYEVFPERFARSTAAGPLDPATLPDWAIPCDWDTDPVIYQGPPTPLQFFGGDLDGIVEHLDHIQALGANTIYLRPVFPARSNHRYNATSFDLVDPLLGGDEALRRLADAVHARGMRLIGDITTNHCGDDHEWFQAAQADPDAPERAMFYFDADGGYEAWYGVPSLPKLNWTSPLVHDRVGAVMRRWLDVYDGWRVDVANMTGRFGAQEDTREIAAGLRREVVARTPEAMLIAEHTHDSTGDLDADGWQGTMNHAGFTRPVWTWLRADGLDLPDFIGVPGGVPRRDGDSVVTTMRAFAAQVSWRSLVHSWQLLDSYDVPRFRTVVGSRERHLVGLGLQMTLPGTPMVCGGAEWGLTGRNGEHARTPMPWQRPEDRDDVLFKSYQDLIRLRTTEPALRDGGLRWLHVGADAIVFVRETAAQSLLVAAVRSTTGPIELPLDAPLAGLHDAADLSAVDGTVTLPGDGPALRVWRIGGPAGTGRAAG